MRFTNDLTDPAALRELGERLAQTRVRANLTQADLATEAGVSLPTVKRLEAGNAVTTEKLLRVLRVLGLLEGLEMLVPAPGPSPLELLEHEGQSRQRVRHPSKSDPQQDDSWTWGED